jgi:hypothetical protein
MSGIHPYADAETRVTIERKTGRSHRELSVTGAPEDVMIVCMCFNLRMVVFAGYMVGRVVWGQSEDLW